MYSKNRIVTMGLAILCLLSVIIPYLLVAFYAGPSADDFSSLYSTLCQPGSNFFVKAIRLGLDGYFTWQGTYFVWVLGLLAGSIFHYGGTFALHIEYIVGILFFFFSVAFVIYKFVRNLNLIKRFTIIISLILSSCISIIILYNYDVSEVFYWHSGATAYTIPLSISLIVVGLILSQHFDRKTIIIASLLAFLACGGPLSIAAFTCECTFLVAIYRLHIFKKIDSSMIVFAVAFAGALINTLAPGNYIRHTAASGSTSLPIVQSITYSLVSNLKSFWDFFKNGKILVVFLVCILLFNTLKKSKIEFINPAVVTILFYVCSAVIDFPVFLGYGKTWYYPLRCQFVRNVTMTFYVFVIAINLTGWVACKCLCVVKVSRELMIGIVATIIIMLGFKLSQDSWESIIPLKMYSDLLNNDSLKEFESVNDYIIYTLKNAGYKDVIIRVPSYSRCGYLKSIGLTADSTHWINVGAANYYGNKSVVFKVGN